MVWDWSVFLGAGLSLMLFSYLWKPNVAFEISESIYIGVSVANAIVIGAYFIWQKGILELLGGRITYIIPIILGVLLYTRFTKEYKWMSRIALSVVIGTGIGLGMRGYLHSYIINALNYFMGLDLGNVGNILYAVGFVSATSYFIFGEKLSGNPILKQGIIPLGRLFLMLSFGVQFGNVIWGRLSLFMGVTGDYILKYPGHYWIPVAVLLIAGSEIRDYMRRKKSVPE